MINEFYAVTRTSVYHVKDKGSDDRPEVVKIALRGSSAVPIGGKLEGGYMVAIAHGIIMYIPEGGGYSTYERRLEGVNTRYWGDSTSSIVALFKTKAAAMKCFKIGSSIRCDPRWLKQTKSVIEAIGQDHPAFEVCEYPELRLLS